MSVVIGKSAFWAKGFYVLPEDEDQPRTFKFSLRFKRLKTSRHKELQAQIDSNPKLLAEGKPAAITDTQLLDEVLADWKGFPDAQGNPVMYTPQERLLVCEDNLGLEGAMVRCWMDNYYPAQVMKEQEKNSGALSATT